jgi:hypothetical protein
MTMRLKSSKKNMAVNENVATMFSRPNTTQATWQCQWCKKTFVREAAYLEHQCKQKKRAEEIQTPTGQAAWKYYADWLRAKKRQPPHPTSFLSSRYYVTFTNIAKFIRRVNLPFPDRFIRFMVEKDIEPTMWCSDFAYSQYIEYLDMKSDPMEQVNSTIDTILKITDRLDVDPSTFFEVVDPSELIDLVRCRHLSPWFLLLSFKFKELLKHGCTPEQRLMFETIIRPEYWIARFDESPDVVDTINILMEELDL